MDPGIVDGDTMEMRFYLVYQQPTGQEWGAAAVLA